MIMLLIWGPRARIKHLPRRRSGKVKEMRPWTSAETPTSRRELGIRLQPPRKASSLSPPPTAIMFALQICQGPPERGLCALVLAREADPPTRRGGGTAEWRTGL